MQMIPVDEAVFLWISGASIIGFVFSIIIIPWLLIRLPADYFSQAPLGLPRWFAAYPIIRFIMLFAKNLVGLVLIVVGVVLLLMPGQGILTILVGVILVDFPGKYKLECSIIRKHSVLKFVNALRRRAGKAPFVFEI